MKHLKKAQKVFEQVIDLEDSMVHDFLRTACGNDRKLINTVLTLVASHNNLANDTKANIESNIFKLLATTSGQPNHIQKNAIQFNSDRYQIIEKIGDGGMGSVFLCSRNHEGFSQTVAIKILNKVEYSAESIQRFNQEKQILALLEHPNISQFIDTDYLSDGTPFVVMEYTPGLPINEYCTKHQLSTKQKIDLFLQLCGAVEHAHQNLIIHRDIKPSNILVMASGKVKLIDFGIAKDLSSDNELNTQTGHHVMTPAYASPEQLLKKPLNTATDIYSLGVVLYELLTTTRPHDLKKISPGQYEKLLIEGRIELPSKRAADQAHTFKGDLDAITLKTIQTDIKARYPSVTELIADIKRYQDNLPIKARKPDLLYKTKKFIKRNQLALLTTLAFCLLTVVFIFNVLNEKEFAEKERLKAKTISDSFILAFKNADPTQTIGEDIKAIHIMDQVTNIITSDHAQTPLLLKELALTMAEVYYNMGSYDQALQLVELSNHNRDMLSATQIAEWAILKAKILNTTEQFDEALVALAAIKYGNQNQAVDTKFAQAVALMGKGETVDSKNIFDELDLLITASHPLFGEICLTRFSLLHSEDEVHEQERLLNQCLNNQEALSSQQELINNKITLILAKSHQSKLNYDQSNDYYLLSLKITEKIFGKQHIAQTTAYKGLGWNYMQQGNYTASLESQNMALLISEKYFGTGHPNTTNALFNLGHIYSDLKDYDQAFSHYNSAITIMLDNGLSEEKKLAFYYKSKGHLQNELGLYAEAEESIKSSIAIFQLKQGSYVYRVAEMQVLLSHIYFNQEKIDQAKELLNIALPNMYTMHKKGDYYQVLAEELNQVLMGELNLENTLYLKSSNSK